ncbi:hypothetical protein TRIUR3_19242 [Triticum urartu]|uniref:Uncharacterized protein n=1 Tax=Triticum urartu TaxID=4572 RepID=M7ZGY4_TRIUA|nr:hypothetical protein TRIUR3_19242 [Triticum urartu]
MATATALRHAATRLGGGAWAKLLPRRLVHGGGRAAGGRQGPRPEPDQAEEGGAVRPDRRHGAAVRHAAHQGGVPERPDAPAARRADRAQAQRPALALEAVFEADQRFPGVGGGLRGGLHAHEGMASFR